MNTKLSFNNVLLLSDQEEEERLSRMLSELMSDEYKLNEMMKKLIEADAYIFPSQIKRERHQIS